MAQGQACIITNYGGWQSGQLSAALCMSCYCLVILLHSPSGFVIGHMIQLLDACSTVVFSNCIYKFGVSDLTDSLQYKWSRRGCLWRKARHGSSATMAVGRVVSCLQQCACLARSLVILLNSPSRSIIGHMF